MKNLHRRTTHDKVAIIPAQLLFNNPGSELETRLAPLFLGPERISQGPNYSNGRRFLENYTREKTRLVFLDVPSIEIF